MMEVVMLTDLRQANLAGKAGHIIFLNAVRRGRSPMPHQRALVFGVMLALLSVASSRAQPPASSAQPVPGAISKADRERALGILNNVSKGIQERYYDPKMNGVDWSAVTANAREKIARSNSLNEALTQIAVAVSTLHDSHTIFQPPYRPYHLDFGFVYQMFSNRCLVTRVRPRSDAEAKGLRPGAEILTINGVVPKRQNLWNIEYVDNVLDPRPEMQLEVKGSSDEKQKVEIQAKVTNSPDVVYRPGAGVRYDVIRKYENVNHRMRMQVVQAGNVAILKFPWFYYGPDKFYWLNGKIRKSQALVVDLRGDQGGAVDTLKNFVGMFFDHDVKLFDKVERKKTTAEVAKGEHAIYFPGKVIVLVDSESASAAEIFARVMQLEKRGTVMGDRSSGSVMEANDLFAFSSGVDYGAEVTVANLIMTDGKSLEHIGVYPDEMVLPTVAALESGNDPVLAHAAQLLGVTISPEDAGKLFPYEWPED
jgi:C-terminal processing protease CtpA/Prc